MVSEVQIVPVKPADGLVAFASVVVDGQLYLGSIAVHRRLDGSGYRITYPTKKIGKQQLNVYHPITQSLGRQIEQAVIAKCQRIFERSDEHGRYSQVAVPGRPVRPEGQKPTKVLID